ncbi:hypothetical protein AXG93_4207s1020 [Marchantia polymorpha subsp. ruderalis]|uniref:Uncharacterized protein n=1 Tax=Marchantia polymorpha subsp. ruderalis TaxID=1480154 RepID=A0A176VYE0_MARPO|nr:hypothetical protein AXG93_4207s1020 [Marchantia polymorpha subsp. ruderalis]
MQPQKTFGVGSLAFGVETFSNTSGRSAKGSRRGEKLHQGGDPRPETKAFKPTHCVHCLWKKVFGETDRIVRHGGESHFAGGAGRSSSGRCGENSLRAVAGALASGSYVGLVRSGTRAKVAPSTETAKRVESLTTKCATAKTSLQENKKWFRELKSECVELQKSLATGKELCEDELIADLAKRDELHGAELAECEAIRSSKLE